MANNDCLTLTVEEAGKLLGISRAHAYDLARTGEIPSVKLGKRVVIPRRALERFIDGETEERAS